MAHGVVLKRKYQIECVDAVRARLQEPEPKSIRPDVMAISFCLRPQFSERDMDLRVQDLQPVSAPLFRQRLSNAAATYHDALRLFHRVADSLSDSDVEDMIASYHLDQQPQRNSLRTFLRTSSSHDYQSDYSLLGSKQGVLCCLT